MRGQGRQVQHRPETGMLMALTRSVALLCAALCGLAASPALAEPLSAAAPPPAYVADSSNATELSSQNRKPIRRAPHRVRIHTPREIGPDAVRICNAHYEQEYRPSGTVIVPRMQCYWRN